MTRDTGIIGAPVWKKGAGYEGPGIVRAAFKTWLGDWRYVVEHRIEGGRGAFYHIYSDKEVERQAVAADGQSARPASADARGGADGEDRDAAGDAGKARPRGRDPLP